MTLPGGGYLPGLSTTSEQWVSTQLSSVWQNSSVLALATILLKVLNNGRIMRPNWSRLRKEPMRNSSIHAQTMVKNRDNTWPMARLLSNVFIAFLWMSTHGWWTI